MNRKIISAGHISLDITPAFSQKGAGSDVRDLLEPGKLIHVGRAHVHTGGSVANTGLALKILGADVQLIGKIGNDAFGMMIRQILRQHGVEGVIVDERGGTSYSIVIAVPGIDRIFLHHPGVNDTFSNKDIPEAALEDAVIFHFGYPPLMKSMYENEGRELLTLFRRVKEKGISTSLDFSSIDPNSAAGRADWKKILSGVLPYVDFFVPSFEELCYMLDRDKYKTLVASGKDMTELIRIDKDVKPLAEKLLEMGCKVILIKCGVTGMYYQTASGSILEKTGVRLGLNIEEWKNRSGFQPCFEADAVLSATGAGDTSIAAFLASVLRGYTPDKCVALAAAEGACCVTAYDSLSGLKPLDELKARINSGWKTREEN